MALSIASTIRFSMLTLRLGLVFGSMFLIRPCTRVVVRVIKVKISRNIACCANIP